MKCDFVCDIEKLVLLLTFEPLEDFPGYTLGYHRKENYNNLFWKLKGTEQDFCCINREKVTNGANASYVNVDYAADILYMHINSHVICKMESEVFCSSRE